MMIDSAAPAANFTRRLRHTPLRDLVRGRLTGRLDLEQRIAASGLPESLGRIAAETLARTRLSRLERADVADELIAHFRDGLEAGEDAHTLARQFGEPRTAGRLIGRAYRRKRPTPRRLTSLVMRTLLIVITLVIIVYLFGAAQFYLSSPSPHIDYRPKLNAAALALDESERAWPLYREALLKLPRQPGFEGRSNRDPRPGEAGWEPMAAYLDAHTDELALVRRGAQRPGLGFATGYALQPEDHELWPDISGDGAMDDNGLLSILLPHLTELRRLSRALGYDAQLQLHRGDVDLALADLIATLRLAQQVREGPYLIADLVSISIVEQTLTIVSEALSTDADLFSDEQLRDLAHMLAAIDDDLLEARLWGERMAFADVVQRVYTDDGSGDGYLTAAGARLLYNLDGGPRSLDETDAVTRIALGPVWRYVAASREEIVNIHDRLMGDLETYARTPMWERDLSPIQDDLESMSASSLQRLRYLPIVILLPALDKAIVTGDLTALHRDGVLVAIALQLYHRRHGVWPASLDALTPHLLPAAPTDRFTGTPLGYTLRNGQPVVYSVGTNRIDDGGIESSDPANFADRSPARRWIAPSRLEATRSGESTMRIPDGDWVIFPRALPPLITYPED